MIRLLLPPDHLGAWSAAEPLLAQATARFDTGFTTEDLLCRVGQGRMYLWQIGDWQAAAITQIQTFPQYQSMLVSYLGGEGMDEWFDEFMETVELAAVKWGCKYVEAHGRRGWLKPGRKRGYDEITTVFRKAVGEHDG